MIFTIKKHEYKVTIGGRNTDESYKSGRACGPIAAVIHRTVPANLSE